MMKTKELVAGHGRIEALEEMKSRGKPLRIFSLIIKSQKFEEEV